MKIICDFSVFYLDETLPKGSLIGEVGQLLVRCGYRVKVLNTINFSKSMHYNPFAYVHSEKDVLKLVTTLMTNTKGEGSGGDPFWEKSERLLLTALIAYLHYEAPVEEEEAAPEQPAQPARKTCPQCGAPVSDDALFCNKCGAQL